MDRERELPPVEGQPPATSDEAEGKAHTPTADRNGEVNPPRTTDGKATTSRFGSPASGGAEREAGPSKD